MIVPQYGRTLSAEEWSPVIDALLEGQHFVLTTHENSDGDGLGSEVALARVLKAMGKEVAIVNPTEVPPNYQFLKKLYPITLFDKKSEEAIQELSLCDVVVLLDANLHDRMGSLWPHVSFAKELGALKIVCVDHHLEPDDFTDVMVCESYASSTGELVYGLIYALQERLGRELFTPEVAEALYVAVMTDTGSFRFPKTTPYVYQLAGDLVSKGADASEIYDRIYNSLTTSALKLLGAALSAITILDDGDISWLFISQDMIKATGSKLFDTDLIIRYLLSVPSVRVAVLIVEMQDGRTKASFRSRGRIYVNQFAKKYGGGGHMNAAGCLFQFSSDKAQMVLLEDLRLFLKNQID
ncbi:DHH family phosphoesterase [Pelodictyon phaeoclathratiforme]|jgi:phosphoesterase RecJ-like protein|uniref:Phosphoesterase RecJ domain protein n=1 Tax=Pelodictyon phaeoclathratiforme (strain DSM 5477 / BU-1) TaxID=324925 RepID=B4SA60_PELPB|nr:bifunctional oligoribonuclease/PAP phosphatase NrnA [Pelodictyon phaeoclathratiforme]ACF43756.1 phosphoesterase RecJ domain protein [Pelodictyon phaeoclathratiforme BU-1]MBV5289574.1 bifunctional oligoribonuclease/PAP phosphatase NrnA [Pelodictyon phaeoclathratiforme]